MYATISQNHSFHEELKYERKGLKEAATEKVLNWHKLEHFLKIFEMYFAENFFLDTQNIIVTT